MESRESLEPLELCRNYVFRGKCGYADQCCFLHDELARQKIHVPKADPPNKSVITSSQPEDVQPSEEQGMPASIRYLLEGESVHRNPYLKEFSNVSWLPQLLAANECRRLFNVQGKRLRKELTEAFGLLHACKRALKKLQESQEKPEVYLDGGGVTIVDLCCGKGFSSLVLGMSMPEADILAVDRNSKMDLSHFRVCKNLRFQHLDLESPQLAADLAQTLDGSKSQVVLLVGVHLCGMLSIYAADLFKKVQGPAALILAPCCLDKRLPGIKQRAKRLKMNPYTYWCLTLLMEELPICRRELIQDPDVLSERNSFILAVKSQETNFGKNWTACVAGS